MSEGLTEQVGRLCRAWPLIVHELRRGSRVGAKKRQKMLTYEPTSLARADEDHATSTAAHLASKRLREDDSRAFERYKHALSRCIEGKTSRGMEAATARRECEELDEHELASLLEQQEARRAFEKARLKKEKMREMCEDFLVERRKLSRQEAREKCAKKENFERYKAYRTRRGLSNELPVRVKRDAIERHLEAEEQLVAAVRAKHDAGRADRAQRAANRARNADSRGVPAITE